MIMVRNICVAVAAGVGGLCQALVPHHDPPALFSLALDAHTLGLDALHCLLLLIQNDNNIHWHDQNFDIFDIVEMIYLVGGE